jgi:uncharacterized membrane protein YjgN (DUF898 family)
VKNYQIVLNGVMLAMEQREVEQAFSRLFKLSPEKAAAILAKPKTILRSHLDAATAELYREKLLAIGVDVDVRDMSTSTLLTGQLEAEQELVAFKPADLAIESLPDTVESERDFYPRYLGNRALSVDFTGTGWAYFRIWLVNLICVLLSLGLYSAMASMRTRNYWFSHTTLDGKAFGYVGQAGKLLLQRIIAAVWIAFCIWAQWQSPEITLVAAASLFLLPAFAMNMFADQQASVNWRHARLAVASDMVGIYKIAILPTAIVVCLMSLQALLSQAIVSQANSEAIRYVCIMLLAAGFPYWHCALSRFLISLVHCADAHFSSAAQVIDYYKLYVIKAPLLFILLFLPPAIICYTVLDLDPLQVINQLMGLGLHDVLAINPAEVRDYSQANALTMLLLLVAAVWLLAYIRAGVINLRYNGLSLDKTVVASEIRATVLFWLYLSNAAGIVLSAGLFIPFAVIRVIRYRLSSITVHASYDLEEIVTNARSGSD